MVCYGMYDEIRQGHSNTISMAGNTFVWFCKSLDFFRKEEQKNLEGCVKVIKK